MHNVIRITRVDHLLLCPPIVDVSFKDNTCDIDWVINVTISDPTEVKYVPISLHHHSTIESS